MRELAQHGCLRHRRLPVAAADGSHAADRMYFPLEGIAALTNLPARKRILHVATWFDRALTISEPTVCSMQGRASGHHRCQVFTASGRLKRSASGVRAVVAAWIQSRKSRVPILPPPTPAKRGTGPLSGARHARARRVGRILQPSRRPQQKREDTAAHAGLRRQRRSL